MLGFSPISSGPLSDFSGSQGQPTTVTVVVQLDDMDGQPRANMTGLRWAWFDQSIPDLFTAPAEKGAGESTDATGTFKITLYASALASGETGWLIVTDSEGDPLADHNAFSGPVAVL
jgi:hypothetical protein